ncbi:hypothetical protein EDB85DRAFT_1928741, partial [Lactarius pseudohatsudake]
MPMLGSRVGEYRTRTGLYAHMYLSRRTRADSQIPLLQMVATKPYDWTYSTTYAGTTRDPLFDNELHDDGASHLLVCV